MAMKTKNEIAQEIYGLDFADLTPGRKSAVTKEYNEQEDEDTYDEDVEVIAVEIGRISHNGTKKCLMQPGSTVADLLDQSGYTLDERKEKIVEQSSGMSVTLDDEVEDGEVYVIAPEVKSA